MTVVPGTIDRERTRWQFLFPQGLREEYPRPNGKVAITTYTPAWCKGIVSRFQLFRQASEAYGMPAQPLPVQIQHVGIHDIGSIEDRRRVGSIYDLAYVPSGGSIPPGVWALIEWTSEGLELINSGKFNCLSPTNASHGTLSTGAKIPGDFLVEASLVDVPFLESIGTASDFVPFDAIAYTGSRRIESSPSPRSSSLAFSKLNPEALIVRGAQYRGNIMEDEKIEIELPTGTAVPESLIEAIMTSDLAHKKMRAMCREMIDETATEVVRKKVREMVESDLDSLLESRGYIKREMAAPTLPEAVSEAEDLVAQARAIEEQVIGDEVKELVRSKRLLSAHVSDFVARRKTGSPVDGLLRDWSVASTMQGVSGSIPRESAPTSARVTPDAIMAQVEKELIARGKGYSYAEHLKIAKTRINEARQKGSLLEV